MSFRRRALGVLTIVALTVGSAASADAPRTNPLRRERFPIPIPGGSFALTAWAAEVGGRAQAAVDLPKGSAQGPDEWFIGHFKYTITGAPSRSGPFLVGASVNGAAFAQIRAKEDTARRGLTRWDTADGINGPRTVRERSLTHSGIFENYLQLNSVRAGENVLTFVLRSLTGEPGPPPRVIVHDAFIERTRDAPASHRVIDVEQTWKSRDHAQIGLTVADSFDYAEAGDRIRLLHIVVSPGRLVSSTIRTIAPNTARLTTVIDAQGEKNVQLTMRVAGAGRRPKRLVTTIAMSPSPAQATSVPAMIGGGICVLFGAYLITRKGGAWRRHARR